MIYVYTPDVTNKFKFAATVISQMCFFKRVIREQLCLAGAAFLRCSPLVGLHLDPSLSTVSYIYAWRLVNVENLGFLSVDKELVSSCDFYLAVVDGRRNPRTPSRSPTAIGRLQNTFD